MCKKIVSVLLCVCMLFSCVVFSGFAASVQETVAEIALADAVISVGDYATDIKAGTVQPLNNEKDEITAYLVYVTYNSTDIVPTFHPFIAALSYDCIAYIINADGEILQSSLLDSKDMLSVPTGGKLYFCEYYAMFWIADANGALTDEEANPCDRATMEATFASAYQQQAQQLEREQIEELLDNTDSVGDVLESAQILGLKRFVTYFYALLQRICKYVLNGWISFPRAWDKTTADARVEEALNAYCEANNCTVTEIYRADKNYFVPNRQTYFSDGESVGNGVCGVASWEMILGGYRDMGILSALPDDKTMYREIMQIMSDITDELQPKIQELLIKNELLLDKVVNPVLSQTLGMYIDKNFTIKSYEVIGTLDIGIALYLQQYGYTAYAKRVLDNLTIALPVLTPAKRTLLLNNLRSEISSWIYRKTDSKLNLPASFGNSTPDTVLRSLERGEPAIVGCWASVLGDNDLTNHYFVIASLFKVKGEVKISDTKSVTVERTLAEVYDTWSANSVELVDFDALYRTTVCNANSLALLY